MKFLLAALFTVFSLSSLSAQNSRVKRLLLNDDSVRYEKMRLTKAYAKIPHPPAYSQLSAPLKWKYDVLMQQRRSYNTKGVAIGLLGIGFLATTGLIPNKTNDPRVIWICAGGAMVATGVTCLIIGGNKKKQATLLLKNAPKITGGTAFFRPEIGLRLTL